LVQAMDQSHASVASLNANLRDGMADEVILVVSEPAYRFDVCGVFRIPLGEFDAA
jgi:hypothetical protein